MKLRLSLLVLALALLVVPVGFAASPASTAPAVCAAQDVSPASILDSLSSKAQPKSLMFPKCGTCSDAICKGANVGSMCGVGGGGQFKFCADISTCSQDSLTQCLCKTGPPF